MRLPRMRFTVRSACIGVVLVGLNLAAALATANAGGEWLRRRMVAGRTGGGVYRAVDGREEYGVGCLYASDGRGPIRLTEVWRTPLPATLLQGWSPLVASVSVTVLVLTLACGSRGGPLGSDAPDAPGGWQARRSILKTAVRWALLIVSLIALNLAGAVHRPGFDLYDHDAAHPPSPVHQEGLESARRANADDGRPHPPSPVHQERLAWVKWLSGREAYSPCHQYTLKFVGDFGPGRGRAVEAMDDPTTDCLRMEYHDLFVGTPKVLNIEVDGVLVERCPMERGDQQPYHEDETRLPEAIFQDSPDGEATIDFRSDGGILAYAGRSGKMLTRPRLIRTPTYSSLEMHGPLLASIAITGLVLVAVLRRLGPRQRRMSCTALALVALNVAAVFVSHQIGEPPRLLSQLETWVRRGGALVERREEYFSDGSRLVSTRENGAPSWRIEHVERPSLPPTFLRTWWPVIATASITILVLAALGLRRRGPRADSAVASAIDDRSIATRE